MKYPLSSFVPLLILTQSVFIHSLQAANVAQPTTCISSQFIASGDEYWKSIILKLTNNCGQSVDFQNATVTFKNKTAINTSFWGDFAPLPYPDNVLNISSQIQTDGNYLATLNLHFPSYPGANSKLPNGNSIQIKYGVSSDQHLEGSTNVYTGTPVQTGSLILNNSSAKPNNVSQNYALVHLTMNGQIVNDIQLPWANTITLTDLAAGNYSLAPESISDSNGNSYQGSATPASFTLAANSVVNSTVSYTLVQQIGKIAIHLQNLPNELTGYTASPSVLLTQVQTGNAISQQLTWNTTTVVSQLKEGSSYNFSTALINYNGYNCAPTFTPSTAVANGTNTPTVNLTYNCVQVNQDTVTLNINGAPSTLSSLPITLTPNDNSATISQTVNLSNGAGSSTVSLTEGVIYTLSAPSVPGYTIHFSPQPLTVTENAIVTITLTGNAGTPVAINGQLTVCGTQLCNEHGDAIQLKGMSTHGLQWYGQGICVTSGSLDALRNNFKASVIRLSLYVQEGGYETDPSRFTNEVSTLIDEAFNRGIYVIVDWHILNPGDPNYNLTRAKKFFSDIATVHKNKNNILYEIANEPNGVNWATIKSYSEQIIPVIRAIDPKAPILVGTRAWSSLGVSEGATYQEIVNNPVRFPNIMYTFHFYAASHRDEYLNALDNASRILPIFVTEFGTQTYSGDGANDFAMSDRYMQLMASRKIGWTNWNYSDDFRSGAIWKTNTCSSGSWIDSNLKPAGVYIKNKIQTP